MREIDRDIKTPERNMDGDRERESRTQRGREIERERVCEFGVEIGCGCRKRDSHGERDSNR